MKKYPNHIPIIFTSLPHDYKEFKYLINKKQTIHSLLWKMNKKGETSDATNSLFVRSENHLINPRSTIEEIFNKQNSGDGFLYLEAHEIASFGY